MFIKTQKMSINTFGTRDKTKPFATGRYLLRMCSSCNMDNLMISDSTVAWRG